MNAATVFLLYHEIERPGVPLCEASRGYARYAVTLESFRTQLDYLATRVGQVGSVGEWVQARQRPRVVITFDDGCETDLALAAPLIRERGFDATFFITTGFLNKRGYLAPPQVRELAGTGMEIGSHAVTHRYLTDLSPAELRDEVRGSKEQLEQLVGAAVAHFSCPGGRWNERVVAEVRDAGYASMCTSRVGSVGQNGDAYCLPREAVLRDTTEEAFKRLCERRGALKRRARAAVLDLARDLLGNARYEAVRKRLLGDTHADD